MLGTWRQSGAFRGVQPAAAVRAREALMAVELDGFGYRQIGSLSAGQFQRVLFARLLMQDAEVIVLDEPFAAIDARTTRDLLEIVCRWHHDGRTIIAVLHDSSKFEPISRARCCSPGKRSIRRPKLRCRRTICFASGRWRKAFGMRTRPFVNVPNARSPDDNVFGIHRAVRRLRLHAPGACRLFRARPWIRRRSAFC